jgi:hypothetical protein
MDLPNVETSAPLRGWFFLEWGAVVEAVPCRAGERFRQLAAQRRWPTGVMDPTALLELGSLPAWTLRRPKGTHDIDAALRCLEELTRAG